MMAAGVRVWFTEYQVLLQGYNAFEDAIRKGVANRDRGLLFTSNRYVASEYCREEARLLCEHFASDPAKLIELRLRDSCHLGLR
jgi:hypothetical protein